MVLEIRLGDQVRLRKPHPCGSDQWEVVRLGADIGLRCLGCGRRVLLAREVLERRVRSVIPSSFQSGPSAELGPRPSAETQ